MFFNVHEIFFYRSYFAQNSIPEENIRFSFSKDDVSAVFTPRIYYLEREKALTNISRLLGRKPRAPSWCWWPGARGEHAFIISRPYLIQFKKSIIYNQAN